MTSSPSVTSIPPELLGEVFTLTSHYDADAPIRIGSVSRMFHRVVRTTPTAWTNLKLKMQEPSDDARCVRKAGLWFAMSGACLIDLSVQMEMGSVMEVTASISGSTSTSTTPSKDAFPAGWMTSATLVLPNVLHHYSQSIRAFSLQTTNVAEAQLFLSSMYPTPSPDGSISYPLQELHLHASSDGSRSPLTPRPQGQTIACITLPRLSNLEQLRLVNHPPPLACLANVDNVRSLRQLKVVCPLRFAPIPVGPLIDVLKAARGIEVLELDTRLTDDPTTAPSPSQATTFFPPTPSTPSFTSNSYTPVPTPTPTTATSSSSAHSSDSQHHHDLITLPFLTHLSLRVNNLPALLGQLLLPSLHTLKIDDLDGNRPGGATESGVMLRQVLVRMELPCEYKLDPSDEDEHHHLPQRAVRAQKGLEVFDMTSIPVWTGGGNGTARSEGQARSSRPSSRSRADERRAPSDECVWEWCFRRMRTLRELRISKMDTGVVLGLITPSTSSTRMPPTASGEVGEQVAEAEDAILPRLERVKIDHCPSLTATRGRNASPDGALLKFRMKRPEVAVEWSVAESLRLRSRQPSAARPDYLELFYG